MHTSRQGKISPTLFVTVFFTGREVLDFTLKGHQKHQWTSGGVASSERTVKCIECVCVYDVCLHSRKITYINLLIPDNEALV